MTTAVDRLARAADLDGAEPEQLQRLVRAGPGVLLLGTIAVGLVAAVDDQLAARLARVADTASMLDAAGAAFVDIVTCPLMLWLAAFGGVSLARIAIGRHVTREPATDRSLRIWALRAVAAMLLHAALWGAVCFVLLKEGNAHFESALHIVLLAVTMGAGMPLADFFRLQAAQVVLTLGPPLLRDFVVGGEYHGYLAALSVLVGAYTLINGRHQSLALNELLAQRRRNAQLVEAPRRENERSEAANAAKTRFLAAANHDLRQPLHAMGLLAQTLRVPRCGTQVSEVGGHLVECVDGMTQVVDELLDITRLDVGNTTPQWSAFALADLLALRGAGAQQGAVAGRARRVGDRAQRPRSARARALQPGLERDPLHAERRGAHPDAGARGGAAAERRRQRHRHRARPVAAHLRGVLPGRQPGTRPPPRARPGARNRQASQ